MQVLTYVREKVGTFEFQSFWGIVTPRGGASDVTGNCEKNKCHFTRFLKKESTRNSTSYTRFD